jgi:hypothetical protein
VQELRKIEAGFIGFCRAVFHGRGIARSRQSLARWQSIAAFKQSFVALYYQEITQFKGQAALLSDNLAHVQSEWSIEPTDDESFFIDQFQKKCCASLREAIFLLDPGAEQTRFFEQIIMVGNQGLINCVSQKGLSDGDCPTYARLSCIGCLWSLSGIKGRASIKDVLSAALCTYQESQRMARFVVEEVGSVIADNRLVVVGSNQKEDVKRI